MDWNNIWSGVTNTLESASGSAEYNSDTSTQKSTWQTITGWFGTDNGTDTSEEKDANDIRAEKETKVTAAKVDSWITGGTKIWSALTGIINGSSHRIKVTNERIVRLQSALEKSNFSIAGINEFFRGHAKGEAYETVKGGGAQKLHSDILATMTKGMIAEGYIFTEKTELIKRDRGDYDSTYRIWTKPAGASKQAVIDAYNENNVFGSQIGIGVDQKSGSVSSSNMLMYAGLGWLMFKVVGAKKMKPRKRKTNKRRR